jgi:integrase
VGKPSLFHLLLLSLKEQCRFGQSKHAAKKEVGWKPGDPVPGIHGTGTKINYCKVAHQFSRWCAARGVRGDWDAAKSLVDDYIKDCEAKGLAPDTLKKYRSALRKAFRDRELGPSDLPPRRKDQITRSRLPREMDEHVDRERWKDVVDFALATGLRRRELADVRAGDVYRDGAGRLMVHVRRGKGGQPREVHVLRELQDRVLEITSGRDAEEVLFPRIPERLDIHSFRREYSARRLQELREANPGRLERELRLQLAEDLGHHRTNVVTRHYLPAEMLCPTGAGCRRDSGPR